MEQRFFWFYLKPEAFIKHKNSREFQITVTKINALINMKKLKVIN